MQCLPVFSAVSTILLASTYEPAMGFSQYTCLPASSAAMVTGACRLLCRHTSTASSFFISRSSRKSVKTSGISLASATFLASSSFTSATATSLAPGMPL